MGDFCGGIASRYGNVVVTVVAAQGIGFVAMLVLVPLSGEPMPGTSALAWAAIAGASGCLGLGAFYFALSRGTMGLVAPLTALIGAAIPATIGLVSGEPATPVLVAGLGMALMAVVVISLPDAAPTLQAAARRKPGRIGEMALIFVAGSGFAGFFLGLDQARLAGGEALWLMLLARIAGLLIALAIVIGMLLRGRRNDLAVRLSLLPLLILTGLGDLGGNLFFVRANESGDLAVAVVLSSLYPVGTAILARVFLRERLGARRVLGVGLAVAGIALIALG